jgi:uncharacterized protein involved in type VI secretion and phage assembly
MSGVAQVSEVKVRGWDPLNAEAVIGQADAETSTVKISMAPDELADALGGESLVVVDRPVAEQSAADDLAAAIARQVASSAYEATAVAVGSPELKAGKAVSISKVDPALEGDWVITTARHEFGIGPYRTHLEFSGRQDRSLYGLVSNGGANGGSRSSVPGVVVGIVTDNEDPEDMGRIKVQYPWMSDDAESFWARVALTGAGEKRGVIWIPEVGDEVVVAFEHGDIAFPVIVGSLWNGEKVPPSSMLDGVFDGGKVKRSGIVSRMGHSLVFFDADGTSGLALYTSDKKIRIALNETKGKLSITTDKELTVESKGKVTIKAASSLKLESSGSMEIKAGGSMTIKGATVAIN